MSEPVKFTSIKPTSPLGDIRAPVPARPSSGSQFNDVLQSRIAERPLQWSSHALQRLEKRSITIQEPQLDRLDDAVKAASSKGSRSALVLVDNLAFVVAVQNRTVVTALDQDSMKDKVFTNIDTAVLA